MMMLNSVSFNNIFHAKALQSIKPKTLRIDFNPLEVEYSFGGINGLKLIVFANVLFEMICSAKIM